MPQLPSITESQVFKALGDWLKTILPTNTPIVQGDQNRVSPPPVPGVVMTDVSRNRLATNGFTFDPVGDTESFEQPTKLAMQVDLYTLDATSGDWAQSISTLFRSPAGVAFFKAQFDGIAPLYNDDPRAIPFVSGENQFNRRWAITLHFQINPIVTTPQQYADAVNIDLIQVEAAYPAT